MTIRQWLAHRTKTIRGLRADLARMNTDLETLDQHCQRLGGEVRTLTIERDSERDSMKAHYVILLKERLLLKATLGAERRKTSRLEADLASLRDKLVEYRQGGVDRTTRGDSVPSESAT